MVTWEITDSRAEEEIIKEKKADFFGVAQAILKDSNWPKKAIESLL